MPNFIDVVIPTKSNFDGLFRLVNILEQDERVDEIVVVADGPDTFAQLSNKCTAKMKLFSVEMSIGIHRMWNLGIDYLQHKGNHIAFINDDVWIEPNAMSTITDLLNRRPDIGLVSPSWTTDIKDEFHEVTAFGGFCMCVQGSLMKTWRFDEDMKWWYGDNDIITWITCELDLKVGLTGLTKCGGNESHTILNDPPANFQKLIENDARIYHNKWDAKVEAKRLAL
jgi:hypothetical protein